MQLKTYLQTNLLFLVMFQPKFLTNTLGSAPKQWQMFLMNYKDG